VARRLDAAMLRKCVAWCLVIAGAGLLAVDLWGLTHTG